MPGLPTISPCDLAISVLVPTGPAFAWGAHISFHFSLSVRSRSRTDSPLLEFFGYLAKEIMVLIIACCHPTATRTATARSRQTPLPLTALLKPNQLPGKPEEPRHTGGSARGSLHPTQHTGCRPASSRPFAASVCRQGTPPPSVTRARAVGPSASPRQPPTSSVCFPMATLQTALRQPRTLCRSPLPQQPETTGAPCTAGMAVRSLTNTS